MDFQTQVASFWTAIAGIPIIGIVVVVLFKQRATLAKDILEINKESVLGVKDLFVFKPMVKLAEGSYQLSGKYKVINSMQFSQTILPFKGKKASREGEIYVIPGELKFINKVLEENKISIFDMKPT